MSKKRLWTLTVVAVVSVVAFLWVDTAPEPALAADDLVRRFTVVQTSIGNGGNFDGACKAELGNHWRLTDFSDIVEFHDDGGSIPDLVDSLRWNLDYGEPEFPSGEWYLVVSYEGELTWYGRQYFVQRHDHHPPRNFLVHANVDNYHISVGSWYGDGWPALCYSETPSPVQAPAPRDKAALTAFYNATHAYGVKWDWDKNWLSDKPLDEWYGVETDKQGNVTALELPNNGLRGTIPVEIGELTELKRLDLSDNDLAGKIPGELGQLTFLNVLNLSRNNLKGEIPDELETLASLGQVYVKGNELTGCIPNNLQRVEKNDFHKLKIPFCNMDRAVLEAFYDATGGDQWRNNKNWLSDKPLDTWQGVKTDADGRVVKLDLRRNGLKGNIPNEIGELTELAYLNLSTNSLTGDLPESMGILKKIESILLAESGLSGCAPESLSRVQVSDIIFTPLYYCDGDDYDADLRVVKPMPEWPEFVDWGIGDSVWNSEQRAARLGMQWLHEFAQDNRWPETGEGLTVDIETKDRIGRLISTCKRNFWWLPMNTSMCDDLRREDIGGLALAWPQFSFESIFIKATEADTPPSLIQLNHMVDKAIHEGIHSSFQHQVRGFNSDPSPSWISEGMATYFAAVVADSHLSVTRPNGQGYFMAKRKEWIEKALDPARQLPGCVYHCGPLAIELLVSLVGVEQAAQFYVNLRRNLLGLFKESVLEQFGWPGDPDDWHDPFLETFSISVNRFYDLYECHKDNGFDLKKLKTCE